MIIIVIVRGDTMKTIGWILIGLLFGYFLGVVTTNDI